MQTSFAGEQAHVPPEQIPPQQLALSEHDSPDALHEAHSPFAHTPLQHSLSLWQFPSVGVQWHVPSLHVPLQQLSVRQLRPASAHVGAAASGEPASAWDVWSGRPIWPSRDDASIGRAWPGVDEELHAAVMKRTARVRWGRIGS